MLFCVKSAKSKKSDGILREGIAVKYAFIERQRANHRQQTQLTTCPNVLDRQFTQCTASNQVWVTDIT